jgi:hypothetical protein
LQHRQQWLQRQRRRNAQAALLQHVVRVSSESQQCQLTQALDVVGRAASCRCSLQALQHTD